MLTSPRTPSFIFLFPGQGSQSYQMGRYFYAHEALFRDRFEEADAYLQREYGGCLIDTLYGTRHRASDVFADLHYTHVAIYVVECAMAAMLRAKGVIPHAVLGTSLGEMAAAVVAGCLSWLEGLALVAKQAMSMIDSCEPAGMLAVLQPAHFFDSEASFQGTTLAAVNFDSHFIVSGTNQQLDAIEIQLKQQRITHQRLPVNYGFHSAHIDALIDGDNAYTRQMRTLDYAPPTVAFYSCAAAARVKQLSTTHSWEAIRQPIQFQTTLQGFCNVPASGNSSAAEHHFIDVGPGGTLATFVKYNLSASPTSAVHLHGLLSPFGGGEQARLDTLLSVLV